MINKIAKNARDRMGVTLFSASAIHAFLILTIGFALPNQAIPDKILPTMDIILVHHSSEKKQKKADFLAQASQEGGGTKEEKLRPKSPVSTPNMLPVQGDARQRREAAAPEVTATIAPQSLTSRHSKQKINRQVENITTPMKKPKTADELVERDMEIAKLSAEISDSREASAKKPQHKHINASTQEYQWAGYMEAWRHTIEQVGNLNYPDEAVRQKLYGDLLLDVAINPDGTIYDIKVLKSSRHQVLDDAAIRIVRLSAPFSALPDNLKEKTDVLHIIRTWQFLSNKRKFVQK